MDRVQVHNARANLRRVRCERQQNVERSDRNGVAIGQNEAAIFVVVHHEPASLKDAHVHAIRERHGRNVHLHEHERARHLFRDGINAAAPRARGGSRGSLRARPRERVHKGAEPSTTRRLRRDTADIFATAAAGTRGCSHIAVREFHLFRRALLTATTSSRFWSAVLVSARLLRLEAHLGDVPESGGIVANVQLRRPVPLVVNCEERLAGAMPVGKDVKLERDACAVRQDAQRLREALEVGRLHLVERDDDGVPRNARLAQDVARLGGVHGPALAAEVARLLI
mmetsp:Transcript_2616/g.9580  ORF Transcript_2616/g.9580 Transcript_2616/m.9580 type:complete len:283 (-) Transcript_2616:582-1430(-)